MQHLQVYSLKPITRGHEREFVSFIMGFNLYCAQLGGNHYD